MQKLETKRKMLDIEIMTYNQLRVRITIEIFLDKNYSSSLFKELGRAHPVASSCKSSQWKSIRDLTEFWYFSHLNPMISSKFVIQVVQQVYQKMQC